jgi:hypothetical protein
MSSAKYSRLATSDVSPEFNALDGPSFYSYGVEKNKYKSAFTYTNMPSSSAYQEPSPDKIESPSVLCYICSTVVTVACYALFVLTLPFSAWFALKSVQSYERIVLFRLGRLASSLGPGYVIILPCIDRWMKVDLRMKAFSVPPQKVITADGATIEIGADVYFRVKDAVQSVTNVQDLNHSTRIICQTSLQKHVSKQILADIETDRTNITNALQADVNQMTQSWGVEVGKVELSAVKVFSQPNPQFSQSNNPLSVLGQALFPAGSGSNSVDQLQQFYQLGMQFAAERMGSSSAGAMSSDSTAVDMTSLRSSTAEVLLNAVKPILSHELVQEFGCIYRFLVTDETGASNVYYLDLKHGDGSAGVGEPLHGVADATLTLTSGLLRDLLKQRIKAFDAYMGGQLSVLGDLRVAMKLGQLFENMKGLGQKIS